MWRSIFADSFAAERTGTSNCNREEKKEQTRIERDKVAEEQSVDLQTKGAAVIQPKDANTSLGNAIET